MTRDDILRMAREAGMAGMFTDVVTTLDELERFFRLAYEAGAAAERTRACRIVTGLCISDNNAREINEAIRAQGQRTTQFCAVAEQARQEEREACARVCDAVAESANKAAVAGQYLVVRNGAEARRCSAAIRAQAADRLARHGISIPEDEEYGNPSF
jgi:hypothetical protein